MHLTSDAVMDLVGIGIGPANLSLAALLRPHQQIKGRFFDKRSEFQWHSGLMLPQAALQVPYLKDLVSLVDPTNELSFLSFLVKHKRLLCFMNANFPQVLRREFNQYYRWACEQIPDLQFDSDIESVDIEGGLLVVKGSGGTQATRNVVLGTGQQPSVPACAKPWLGTTLLHASQYLLNNNPVQSKRVVVVGGGQTGAEVFQHLISNTDAMPASVAWVSRRWNFFPLDESSFTNELYTPEYSDYFYGLSETQRRQLLAEQKLASDGISPSLLESIYRRVYELRNVLGHPCDLHLQPGRELVDVTRNKGGWALELKHAHSGIREALDADVVVLCTGYDYRMPAFLDPIAGRIDTNEGEFVVDEDYSIRWDGLQDCRIYVQNAARSQRGIADPNLGLIPWRCARIINSVAHRAVYDVEVPAPFVSWDARSHSSQGASPSLRMAS